MMKKLFFAIAAIALVAVTACDKTPKAVNATVTIDESGLSADVPKPDAYAITLTNTTTAETFKADSENNSASFVLTPGIYNVLVEGHSAADGVAFNISGSEKLSALEEGATVAVKVNSAKSTALIFKELYYCGVKNGDASYFRDIFFELYNNSDQIVYADNLCICALDMYNYSGEPREFEIENADKYVYSEHVWQIPGDGDDYPVGPGESIVIAQWATNHKIESLGGDNAKDLTGAEFEAILGETTLWNGTVITDNPAVNMQLFGETYSMPQWLPGVGGKTMIIFFPPEGLSREMTYEVGSSSQYSAAIAIPADCILDAVRCCENDADGARVTVPAEHDSGYIFCSGMYANESVVRKIAETKEDGRIVYQDTNNTASDFEVKSDPQIRRNGAKVPSWNTWN